MIKLSSGSKRFYTGSITHTGSASVVVHTVTHNLNTKKINVDLIDEVNNLKIVHLYFSGGDFGYAVTGLTLNSCEVRLYQWYPGPGPTSTRTVTVIVTALD